MRSTAGRLLIAVTMHGLAPSLCEFIAQTELRGNEMPIYYRERERLVKFARKLSLQIKQSCEQASPQPLTQ